MPSQGPFLPGSGVDGGGGTVSWANPTEVLTVNGAAATCDYDYPDVSSFLEITDFGFTVPGGVTITDIAVDFNDPSGFFDGFSNDTCIVALTKDGVTGASIANSGGEGAGWVTQGTGLWGTTWTPAEVNASTFGVIVEIDASNFSVGGPYHASIEAARITVTWTVPGGAAVITEMIQSMTAVKRAAFY